MKYKILYNVKVKFVEIIKDDQSGVDVILCHIDTQELKMVSKWDCFPSSPFLDLCVLEYKQS